MHNIYIYIYIYLFIYLLVMNFYIAHSATRFDASASSTGRIIFHLLKLQNQKVYKANEIKIENVHAGDRYGRFM